MTPEQLELLARKAILEKQVAASPFSKIAPPLVQIWMEKRLTNFPIPHTYVGQRFSKSEGRNGHIYNLCAHQILRHLERYKQEFDLNR